MKLRDAQKRIVVGTRVRYSAEFLRNTGQFSGEVPHLRGEVTMLEPLGQCTLATVSWNNGRSSGVLVANLWPCELAHLEPA